MSYSQEQLAAMVRGDSVHRGVYTDPAIFDLEMQRIYGRAWIYVGHESQVPKTGDYHTTRLGDQDVLMVRASDGNVHVLYNRCPHKGAKVVADGEGCVGKFFRCPYHAWTFKLDGSHLGVPLKQGLEGTAYDPTDPTFSMRRLARVESYRGFVFASQAKDGPALTDFLGGVRSSIDNLCDRSPVGEVEVAGGIFRVMQRSNWKVFYENLHDTMHARVTHESSYAAARDEAKEIGEMPLELHIMDGNGEPYEFWEKLELRAYDNGHGYMEGIFNPGAAERDPVSRAHFETLTGAYGEERAREILGMNRHNTVIYGSGSPHTVFQQFRVIRPIAVDRTLIEIQTFRCKGAPEGVFKRAMLYANVINSPSSNVMPDDIELYNRCQEGNATRGGDWVSMHRYHGSDRSDADGLVSVNGTSELPMRNQFRAWKTYMEAGAASNAPATGEGALLLDLDFDVGTTDLSPADVPADAYHRIAQFLYREARLLDERRYDDWQSLWTPDGMYWMPRVPGQQSPYDHISLFWEDRMLRDVRIRRLEHPRNWSQQPPTRSVRLVGAVQVEGVDAGGNLVVHSAFQMTEWRKRQPRQLAGRYTHKLAAEGDGWRIRMKRVDLVNCDDAHDVFEVFV